MKKNYFLFIFLYYLFIFPLIGQNVTENETLTPPEEHSQQQQQQIEGKEKLQPSPLSFEAMPGELLSEEEDVNKLSPEMRALKERNAQTDELWKNADYYNYDKSFASLYELSPSFANNKYRQALAAYQAGINTIIRMREKEEVIRKESEDYTRLNEKWYWQVVDRRAREERRIRMLHRVAKLQAVTYITRAIQHTDEIINKQVRETPTFKKLLSALYRNWVMHQYDLGNLPQCIPVLELYIQINDNEKEYAAHKYLAQSYSFQETQASKSSLGNEEQVSRFRYKKNTHQLRAAELKYGKDSVEYKHIVNMLNRDEFFPKTTPPPPSP